MAEIKRTANFTLKETELQDIDWLNDRIQPVFLLKMPDGNFIEWNLGVFLLSSPTRKDDNGSIWREIEAYDSSIILTEDKFDNRYIIPANTKYVDAIKTIINSAGIRKINIVDNSGVITVDKEFEIGSSKLSAINSLLYEINYTTLWVDENGYFTTRPYSLPTNRDTEYEYRSDSLSVIYNETTEELNIFNAANCWIVTASNPEKIPLTSKYENNMPSSKTSIINRSRKIVYYRTIDDILDQTTLDSYTRRIAYEASQVYGKLIFTTWCMPHHSFLDMLYIEHSVLGVAAKYTETSWGMELQAGGKMSHNVRRVINI